MCSWDPLTIRVKVKGNKIIFENKENRINFKKKIYLQNCCTVVCCCILLRCEGNWADTKHGEKIQSVEVSTVYSWECAQTECKVSRPASLTPNTTLLTLWWSLQTGAAASVGDDLTVHTPVMVRRKSLGAAAAAQCPPPPLGSDWPQCRGCAGLCWRSRRLCCATPPPPLLCAPPAQVNPGPGLWSQYVLMEAIRWTHGDCLSVFLLMFGLCVVATWLQLAHKQKNHFQSHKI